MTEADPHRTFRTSDFDYPISAERIAQHPADRRESSRLLVLNRRDQTIGHGVFSDVVDLIPSGDVLVINETRVFPARLRGKRESGGDAEVLLLQRDPTAGDRWTALVRPGNKLKPGRRVSIGTGFDVLIEESLPGGERVVRLESALPQLQAIERYGEVPLPPYVRRPSGAEDRERYQTVYARSVGSVAAPTAGLHFTIDLLDRLAAKGVGVARLVLHVGVGTFRPVETDDPAAHRMHSEWYSVPEAAARTVNSAREASGSVWAVGTTSVRTLETVAGDEGRIEPGEGWTDIFIRPPYRFRAVDHLITNFHLPRSTLLMLVAAFAGYEPTMNAYDQALEHGYRFFSYGDAMAIL